MRSERAMKVPSRALAATLLLLPVLTGAATPAWVEESNRNAQPLLEVTGRFNAEFASSIGLDAYDGQVVDLAPQLYERERDARAAVLAQLKEKRDQTAAGPVRQDLEILVHNVELSQQTN